MVIQRFNRVELCESDTFLLIDTALKKTVFDFERFHQHSPNSSTLESFFV